MPMMKIADRLRLSAPCCPRHSRKWRGVSGGLHRHDENCRQFQVCAHAHENGGTFQAVCMPVMKIADSLRLSALFVHTTHENGGTSQAVCTPHAEHCRQSQALCARAHENCGTSQAVCMLLMKLPRVSGSLHFLCTPFTKTAGRLRRFACPR